MKKVYKKPVVIVESFQLNAAIAGSCSSGTPIYHYEDTCGSGTSTEGLLFAFFNERNCDLDLTLSGGDDNDTNCYHGPIYFDDGTSFVWS